MSDQWEYKTVKFSWALVSGPGFELPELDEFINQFGARGWELVAVSQSPSRDVFAPAVLFILFFKRPLLEK